MSCNRSPMRSGPAAVVLMVFLLGHLAAPAHAVEETGRTMQPFTMAVIPIADRSSISGRWSFSRQWIGYMGMALELDEDGFRYWFYSDLVAMDPPVYPIEGQWSITGGRLRLAAAQDEQLYADEWILVEVDGRRGLFAPKDLSIVIVHGSTPLSRMLFRPDPAYSWPQMNVGGGLVDIDEHTIGAEEPLELLTEADPSP